MADDRSGASQRAGTVHRIGTGQDPVAVVREFLTALADRDPAAALERVDERIVYTNVGLATLRGKGKTARVAALLARPGFGFGVHTITAAADGSTVLTERIDEIAAGPLRMRFWVCGKFVVEDGRITVWRDYFDFLDTGKAFVRAVAGLVSPALNRPMP